MLKIVKTPNNILIAKAQKVEKFDKELEKFVEEMEQTLDSQVDPQGVGLAAPQVGKSIALFIVKPNSKAKTEVFINPRILQTFDHGDLRLENNAGNSKVDQNQAPNLKLQDPDSNLNHPPSKKKKRKLEGCLSIGKIWGPVNRSDKLRIEYQDIKGRVHQKWFSGFKAVIIQHEIDHLHGVLFTQRVLEQKGQLYEEKDGELTKLEY